MPATTLLRLAVMSSHLELTAGGVSPLTSRITEKMSAAPPLQVSHGYITDTAECEYAFDIEPFQIVAPITTVPSSVSPVRVSGFHVS